MPNNGITLIFNTERAPQITLGLDTHGVISLQDPSWQLYCYGEVLSYRRGGTSQICLQNFMNDLLAQKPDFQQLNGRFILFLYDKIHHEWLVITDRVGSFHGYMVKSGEYLNAVGTDLSTLASQHSRRDLDWEAILSFFSLGFFLDDRTYFKDIQMLLPSSVYRISANGQLLEHLRYWEWYHSVDANRSYRDTVEIYHILLKQAVDRCIQHGSYILPISGGLDSRSIAGMLPKEIQSYSYGYTPNSIEIAIANSIAKVRAFHFKAHVIHPYLFERIDEITRVLHGCQDITQARQCSVNAWVKENGTSILTGLWGDVWCNQMGLADGLPKEDNLSVYTLKKFQKSGHSWLINHLCQPQLYSQQIDLKMWIETGLDDFAEIEDLDFRIKAYKTSRWAFRWSNASLRGFELGATPRIPYYDIDLINFFCTVPTAFVRERRLQIDQLKFYAPELASIKWQETGVNLYCTDYAYLLSLPGRLYRKSLRAIRGQRPIQRNWEAQFFHPEGRFLLEQWLLRSQSKIRDFISVKDVTALLDDLFTKPNSANGYCVSMLLTFSVWLEVSA